MPFFSKDENREEKKSEEMEKEEMEKKIEFSQKLPAGDLEGASSPKGGNFDFLKGLEDRREGEAVPVTMHPEARPDANNSAVKENGDDEEEKEPKGSWFSRFFKFRGEGFGKADGKKMFSRVLEVNLVRGEIVKFFDWQKGLTVLVISVFASLAFLSLIYWGISWWGTSRQTAENTSYAQDYYRASKEIKDLNPRVEEVLKFKERLDLVNFLLDRHIYWTNFFNFLEDNTLANVYFSSFGGDIKGIYTMQATTDNLDAIDAQIKLLLANQKIKKASVNAGSIGGEKGKSIVSFALSFELDPSIFLK
jgi:hypothetical protein